MAVFCFMQKSNWRFMLFSCRRNSSVLVYGLSSQQLSRVQRAIFIVSALSVFTLHNEWGSLRGEIHFYIIPLFVGTIVSTEHFHWVRVPVWLLCENWNECFPPRSFYTLFFLLHFHNHAAAQLAKFFPTHLIPLDSCSRFASASRILLLLLLSLVPRILFFS